MKSRWKLAGAALAASLAAAASAAPITYLGSGTGPGGVPVAASATFDIAGDNLTITLRNTSGSNSGQDVPGSTLSGLFWDFTGSPTLTPVSAMLASGSSIIGAPCSPASCVGVTNVGGEFGYQATSFPGGADRGISSSGYLSTGLTGNRGNFNNGAGGVNLDSPVSLDGINFGIVSAASGFNPNLGLASVPLVQDAVVFLLTGVSGLSNADISNVSFQYGTALTELNVPGDGGGGGGGPLPEPASLALAAVALVAAARFGRARG
jgi:hypothetical protein